VPNQERDTLLFAMMMGITTCENATSAPSQDVEKEAFVKAFGAPALREPFNRKAALCLKGSVYDMPLEHKLAVRKLLKESQVSILQCLSGHGALPEA